VTTPIFVQPPAYDRPTSPALVSSWLYRRVGPNLCGLRRVAWRYPRASGKASFRNSGKYHRSRPETESNLVPEHDRVESGSERGRKWAQRQRFDLAGYTWTSVKLSNTRGRTGVKLSVMCPNWRKTPPRPKSKYASYREGGNFTPVSGNEQVKNINKIQTVVTEHTGFREQQS